MEYNKYQIFETVSGRDPTVLAERMTEMAQQGFRPIGSVFIFEFDCDRYLCMLMGKW
jgi:hypothetical protein